MVNTNRDTNTLLIISSSVKVTMLDSVTLYKMQAETILIQLQSVYKESEIRQPQCVDDNDSEKYTDCDEKELSYACTVRQIKHNKKQRQK